MHRYIVGAAEDVASPGEPQHAPRGGVYWFGGVDADTATDAVLQVAEKLERPLENAFAVRVEEVLVRLEAEAFELDE